MRPEQPDSASVLLQTVFDFFPDAAFAVDHEGKAVLWNKRIEDLTAVPRSEIIGTDSYMYAIRFFGEEKHALIELALSARPSPEEPIKPSNHAVSTEAFVPSLSNGRGLYLRATASPVFDSEGRPIGALEVIRDITDYKRLESRLLEVEKKLEGNSIELNEFSSAFKVLLHQKEQHQKELEESILANLKESILPYTERLGKTELDDTQRNHLTAIENTLHGILSPFLKKISRNFNLTPMEIQVADLVRSGNTSKEIASILGIAEKTVSTHRYNLRIKLGLKNNKVNLRSHLIAIR